MCNISKVGCCWSLLHGAILRSWTDPVYSCRILHEWIAFYHTFLNIHQSGILGPGTAGAAWNCCCLGAGSVYIQPCTMSLHVKPYTYGAGVRSCHLQGACVLSCNLPPALSAEWVCLRAESSTMCKQSGIIMVQYLAHLLLWWLCPQVTPCTSCVRAMCPAGPTDFSNSTALPLVRSGHMKPCFPSGTCAPAALSRMW